MKNLQKLDDFRALGKNNLIEEMMKDTIKGGCCEPTYNRANEIADWENLETGEIRNEPWLD